jgi:hypothetical protein
VAMTAGATATAFVSVRAVPRWMCQKDLENLSSGGGSDAHVAGTARRTPRRASGPAGRSCKVGHPLARSSPGFVSNARSYHRSRRSVDYGSGP